MEMTINLPESVQAELSTGIYDLPLSDVPADIIARLIEKGFSEVIQDAGASALADAFEAANPDHGLKGDALKTARKEWGESHPDVVAAQADQLRRDRLERIKAGEWVARSRGSAATFNDFQLALYDIATRKDVRTAFKPVAKAWAETKGMPTADRRTAILNAVNSLSKADRERLEGAAQSQLDAVQNLFG